MKRRLTCDPTPLHRTYFRLLAEAFRSRGSAPADRRISKEEKRTDATILRAIKAISDPVGEAPAAGDLDLRPRALKPEGGVIELDQPAFKRLHTYCEENQWVSSLADVATDLDDWLDSAEKVES